MTKRAHYPYLFAVAILSLSPLLSPVVVLAVDSSSIIASTSTNTSTKELSEQIGSRLMRVPEFDFIRHEAERLGVKAYLFGGTAAGYAHYVKWDMLREKGDKRYQPDRFDYDYTNIYRSTQDLDIVIDGNAEQAQKLQAALQEKYPHLQGSKTAWEVRLLTQDMGDKQAILNNPDFLNQHTDSNSTGMIEITKPTHGDPVVRDVRDWKSKEPFFLKDIHEGTLHYYFSPLHETTKFAKEGRNPPIVSAIRFLTKAFQYELKIKPEDLARIQKIIHDFDPKRDTQNSYVANWLEKNGKKLIQNAINIEYARHTLDQLGLRTKLSAIKANPQVQESLSWWMNKEPLRTQPIGHGSGKTARELGLDVVSHETNNYLAYESITRAHTGDPNVLISRNGAAGEAALHGDGFYARTGKEGARGTGLTIRFRLDPNAREGVDFEKAAEDYVVVKNKAAIRVIPESLNISPVDYMEMIAAGKLGEHSDLGIRERLERKMTHMQNSLSAKERETLLQMLRRESEMQAPSVTFLASFKTIFPNLYAQMDDRTRDNLNHLALKLIKNVKINSDPLPTHLQSYLALSQKELAPQLIHAFLQLDKIPLKADQTLGLAHGKFFGVFDKYLSQLSPEVVESTYKKLLPTILSIKPPQMEDENLSAKGHLHSVLMRHLLERNPELIRPLLRHPNFPDVRHQADSLIQEWQRNAPTPNAPIPWLNDEKIHSLRTGDSHEKKSAIQYFLRNPVTDEVDQLIYQELRSGEKQDAIQFFTYQGSVHPDSERLVYDYLKNHSDQTNGIATVANYFTKHPPQNIEIINDLVERTASSEFTSHFTDVVAEAARKKPHLLDRITDVRILAKADCKTERCVQLYLKALHLDVSSAESLKESGRYLKVLALRPLTPPVDHRITEALGKIITLLPPNFAVREYASFLYAQLEGKDPQVLQEALHIVDGVIEKTFHSDPKLPEKRRLRQKLSENCLLQNLTQVLK
jgi:hypothetical protein